MVGNLVYSFYVREPDKLILSYLIKKVCKEIKGCEKNTKNQYVTLKIHKLTAYQPIKQYGFFNRFTP